MSSPNNKIGTKAKLRLRYHHLRLQISAFFTMFKRQKPPEMQNGAMDEELEEEDETSFSVIDPRTVYCSMPYLDKPSPCFRALAVSKCYESNDQWAASNPPRVNLPPPILTESVNILQRTPSSRKEIASPHCHSTRLSRTRTTSSNENIRERSNANPSNSCRKRRSSRTRIRRVRHLVDTEIINGDQPQDFDDDKYEKNEQVLPEMEIEMPSELSLREAPKERSSFLETPSTEYAPHSSLEVVSSSPSGTFTAPGRNRFSSNDSTDNSYTASRKIRFARPEPPDTSQFRARPNQPLSHQQSPGYSRPIQPKSILRNSQPALILQPRKMHPETSTIDPIPRRKYFSKLESNQPLLPEVETNKTNKPNIFRSFGSKFMALGNRKRDPSVYEKEPRLLQVGFRFVYQSEPIRQGHINTAQKKAGEKADSRELLENDEDDPSPCLLALAKFIPRWLKSDHEDTDELLNSKESGQRFHTRASVKPQLNPQSRQIRSGNISYKPTHNYNRRTKTSNPANFSDRNPDLAVYRRGGGPIETPLGFAQQELRPQNYQVYGQTTTNPSPIANSGDTWGSKAYQPKSHFTAQFQNLLQKKVTRAPKMSTLT